MIGRYHVLVIAAVGLLFLGVGLVKNGAVVRQTAESQMEALSPDSLREGHQFWRLFRRANKVRTDGAYRTAINHYRNVLKMKPDHEDARFFLANSLLQVGRLEEAEEEWQQLLEKNPESSRVRGQLAALWTCSNRNDQHNLSAAKHQLRAILHQHGAETQPLIQLTEILIIQDSLDAAIDKLRTLEKQAHLAPAANFLQGYVAWRQNKTSDAKILLGRAREQYRSGSALLQEIRRDRVPDDYQNDICRALGSWRTMLRDSGATTSGDRHGIYQQFDRNIRAAAL